MIFWRNFDAILMILIQTLMKVNVFNKLISETLMFQWCFIGDSLLIIWRWNVPVKLARAKLPARAETLNCEQSLKPSTPQGVFLSSVSCFNVSCATFHCNSIWSSFTFFWDFSHKIRFKLVTSKKPSSDFWCVGSETFPKNFRHLLLPFEHCLSWKIDFRPSKEFSPAKKQRFSSFT